MDTLCKKLKQTKKIFSFKDNFKLSTSVTLNEPVLIQIHRPLTEHAYSVSQIQIPISQMQSNSKTQNTNFEIPSNIESSPFKYQNISNYRCFYSFAFLFSILLFIVLVCTLLPYVDCGCHKKKIIYKKIKIKLPFLATKKIKIIEKFKFPFQVLVAVPFYFKFPIKVRCGKKKKKLYIKMDYHTKHKKHHKHDDHKHYDDDPNEHDHHHHDDGHHHHLHHDESHENADILNDHSDEHHADHSDHHHEHPNDYYEDNGEDDMAEGLDSNLDEEDPLEDDSSKDTQEYDKHHDDHVEHGETNENPTNLLQKEKNLLASDNNSDDSEDDDDGPDEPETVPSDDDDSPGEEHVEIDSEDAEKNVKKVSYGNTEEVKEKGFSDDDDDIDENSLIADKRKKRSLNTENFKWFSTKKKKKIKKMKRNQKKVKVKKLKRRSVFEQARLIGLKKIPKILIKLAMFDWKLDFNKLWKSILKIF